jgi:hypothetical protein
VSPDSVSENHFFSLSCLLHPHVRATPDYSVGESLDRAWPQHLYLSPSSPLLKHMTLPPHFNIETTPLVSFRRNDVLFSRNEMEAMYPRVGEYDKTLELFSDEKAWFISPEEYMPLFTTPRPEGAGYSTLIVSTGGHWTTGLFRGLPRISGVRGLFIVAMQHWADIVQGKLAQTTMDPKNTVQRRVLVRAYLPGNEKCHERRAPFTQYPEGEPYSWNWGSIQDFNKQMEVRRHIHIQCCTKLTMSCRGSSPGAATYTILRFNDRACSDRMPYVFSNMDNIPSL